MFYEQRKTDADVLICEGACVVGDVNLAPGVSVWYNAVLRGDEGRSLWAGRPISRTASFSMQTL